MRGLPPIFNIIRRYPCPQCGRRVRLLLHHMAMTCPVTLGGSQGSEVDRG